MWSGSSSTVPAAYWVIASRGEMLAKHREIWSQMLSEVDQPLWETLTEKSGQQMVQQMSESTDQYRYALITLLLPAIDAALCSTAVLSSV